MQEERGPRKPKTAPAFLNRSRFKTKLSKLEQDNQEIGELSAQILLGAVSGARNSTGFGVLSRGSQNRILAQLWGPLFVLRAAHWPVKKGLLAGLESVLERVRALRLDPIELEIVENILLCRPDLVAEPGQASLAELMRNRAVESLIVISGNLGCRKVGSFLRVSG